jgi:hypothetical protein
VQMMELSKPPGELPVRCPTPSQSADDGLVEASELPVRRRPTPGQSRMPDCGPQSSDDIVVEARELSSRRRPTPCRGRMPDGGSQSADD